MSFELLHEIFINDFGYEIPTTEIDSANAKNKINVEIHSDFVDLPRLKFASASTESSKC
jgi:hypothetical protein